MAQNINTILRTPIVPGQTNAPTKPDALHTGENAFGKLLQQKIAANEGIKLSGHAADRIRQRGLEVTDTDLAQLSDAVSKAEAKGAQDTLFLKDNLAFLVNIKNRVVVTVIDQQKLKDDIFTNIDSVALIPGDEETSDSNSGQDLLARMPRPR